MKFLRNKKVVERLQELIDNYIGKEHQQPKKHLINKLNINKKRTGQEM